MTKLNLKNVMDKLKDNVLDLSYCELKEVPVREIASIRKATDVNLSTNLLVSLPNTFVTLRQIVELDLSKNMLTELPENFGEMRQLRHLDLYANKISRLPLSLSELKNLRWLDLKENPLTEAVASVAGPCNNSSECQACARNIVNYLSTIKPLIEEERMRRLNNATDLETEKEVMTTKKENKKKKRKDMDKQGKVEWNKIESLAQNKDSQDNNARLTELPLDNAPIHESHKSKATVRSGIGLYRSCTWIIIWFFVISSLLTIILAIFSWHYEQQMKMFLQNAQALSGLPLKNYHKHITDLLQCVINPINVQLKSIIDMIKNFYEAFFRSNMSNAGKEL